MFTAAVAFAKELWEGTRSGEEKGKVELSVNNQTIHRRRCFFIDKTLYFWQSLLTICDFYNNLDTLSKGKGHYATTNAHKNRETFISHKSFE